MQLRCDISIAKSYKSKPQQSRILSEAWFATNGYCLACDNDRLDATKANTKATDFTCRICNHRYELKTFTVMPRRNLIDGAYNTMIARIMDGTAPTLMMLERDKQWAIQGLTAIHHTFLTPNVIAQRKPLSSTARRAGWIGCNIRLDLITAEAQISVVGDGRPNAPNVVRKAFRKYETLSRISPKFRGWTTLTLKIVNGLEGCLFSLDDLYKNERLFAMVYPGNQNIRPKIRQQLQVLRDLGYIEFLGTGKYRILV